MTVESPSRLILRRERFGGLLFDRHRLEISLIPPSDIPHLASDDRIRVVANELDEDTLLSAPTKVTFVLTNRCNLRCSNCLNSSSPSQFHCLPYPHLRSCFSELHHQGIFEIGFSGGEPTLHPQFASCVRTIRDYGMAAHVNTNGVCSSSTLRNLLHSRPDMVRVSLDGLEETNDVLRGRGAFRKAVHTLRLLREVLPRVGINFTLCRSNATDLYGLIDLAASLHVELKIAPLVSLGRAVNMSSETLSLTETRQICMGISTYRAEMTDPGSVRMVTELSTNHCPGEDDSVPFPRSICGVGRMHLGIDSDGNAYPTGSQTEFRRDGSVGHIAASPMAELWRRAQRRQQRRAEQMQKCRNCDVVSLLQRSFPTTRTSHPRHHDRTER